MPFIFSHVPFIPHQSGGHPYPAQQYGGQPYAGHGYSQARLPGPPYAGQSTGAHSPRKSPAVPVVLALLAVLIIGLGGAVAWVALTKNSSADVASASRSNANGNAVAPTTSAATSPSRPTATVTTTVQPPSTRVTAPTTRPSRDVGVSGADGQGFLGNSGARCNADNPAVAIARTTKSYVVVCETGVGRYYYKGVRAKDGAAIEIDDPAPTSSGFVATSNGTQYRLDSSALTMTSDGEVLGTEPVLEYYLS